MPPSDAFSYRGTFSSFGMSIQEAGQAMAEFVAFLKEDVEEKLQREKRLMLAPEVLREVIAPQLDGDARVLIWELANDLEQHLIEWSAIEDDQASLADDMKKHLKRGSRTADVRSTQSASSQSAPER